MDASENFKMYVYKITVRITSLKNLCAPTQVIFIQLDLLHYRRHYKGKGLPVKVIQRIAHEHSRENSSPVVAISRLRHSVFKLSSNNDKRDSLLGCFQLSTDVSAQLAQHREMNFASRSSEHCRTEMLKRKGCNQ